MRVKFKNRTYNIDDKYIEKNMKVLGISKDEAIQQWFEDCDLLENEEKNKLIEKGKNIKIDHGSVRDPSKTRKSSKKDDPDKEFLQNLIGSALKKEGIEFEVTNKGKMIELIFKGNGYKIDLIKTRKPK